MNLKERIKLTLAAWSYGELPSDVAVYDFCDLLEEALEEFADDADEEE